MKKKIIISGIAGQDGSLMAKYLLRKNYKVYGIVKNLKNPKIANLKLLNIDKKIYYLKLDISDHRKIANYIKKIKPDIFFNFAGVSSIIQSSKFILKNDKVNNFAVLNILESIRKFSNKTKFFQASSAELFKKENKLVNEKSVFEPKSPYAIAKLSAYYYLKFYRETYNLFAVNAFMLNHESPFRRKQFITKKIVSYFVKCKLNKKSFKPIKVGNINSQKDWGDAEEYMKIAYKVMMLKKGSDYLICSGKLNSVKFFIDKVASLLKIKIIWIKLGKKYQKAIDSNGKVIVTVDNKLFRDNETNYIKGNNKKISKILNLRIKSNIESLIKKMVKFEIKNASN